MRIKVADSAGFCWGVKRAVDMAVRSLRDSKGRVFCFGELIHNRLEIERLKKLGMKFVEDMDEIRAGDTVIVRSHGVSPNVMEFLKNKGARIVDATCPFVKDVHKKVMKLESEGYPVLILGNPNHPEVVGIAGHVKNYVIASTVEELEKLPPMSKLGVVCQTTLNISFLKKAVSVLSTKVKELIVYNTICNATAVRQRETEELARKVNVMLVVGGKNSSNTTKLYQIAKEANPQTYHVESKEEVRLEWFEGAKSVGITAGASTPQWVIDEIVEEISRLKGGTLSGKGICKAAGGGL